MRNHKVIYFIHNYKEPIAVDNCEIKKVTLISGTAGGDVFKEGINEIVYEAIDNSANIARTSFKVNVVKKAIQSITQNKVKTPIQIPTLQKTDTAKVYEKKIINDTVKVYDKKVIYDTVKIINKKRLQILLK